MDCLIEIYDWIDQIQCIYRDKLGMELWAKNREWSFMWFSAFDVKSVDEDTTFFWLAQYFFEIIIRNNLFFEVLHDFGSSVSFVLVSAHYWLQKSFPSILANV